MDKRSEELIQIRTYTEEIDNDLTMILQSLQWDRKYILQHPTMVTCKYDPNHKIIRDKAEGHEQDCLLRQNGYTKEDQFLPEPFSITTNTLKKFGKADIASIIDNAARTDPTFKRVCVDTLHGRKLLCLLCIGSGDLEPQTLSRLQCAYSMDERRVLYDAVVSAVPFCSDLSDLALPSVGNDGQVQKTKSRTEILAELRDMRRRRTKYRVATKSKNYSDVLRDVIKTQMELYNEVLGENEIKPNATELRANKDRQVHDERSDDLRLKGDDRDRHERELYRRERNRDSEKYKEERSNKRSRDDDGRGKDRSRDYSSGSREHRDRFREIRYDKSNNSDHRTREMDNKIHRDKSSDTRHRDKSKDYDEKRDREYGRKERHSDGQSREYKQEAKLREHERSLELQNIKQDERLRKHEEIVEKQNIKQEESDTERARNLLTEIKCEIDSVDRSQGDVPNTKNRHKLSDEFGHGKRYREPVTRDNKYYRYERDEIGHRYSDKDPRHSNNGYSYSSKYKDTNSKERSGDRKRHKDSRESDFKEYRDKHNKDKESDRSYEKEAKRSRAADKHKTYYEIYAELDKRRNKKHEQNND